MADDPALLPGLPAVLSGVGAHRLVHRARRGRSASGSARHRCEAPRVQSRPGRRPPCRNGGVRAARPGRRRIRSCTRAQPVRQVADRIQLGAGVSHCRVSHAQRSSRHRGINRSGGVVPAHRHRSQDRDGVPFCRHHRRGGAGHLRRRDGAGQPNLRGIAPDFAESDCCEFHQYRQQP